MDLTFETLFASLEIKWTGDKNIGRGSNNNYHEIYFFSQNWLLYLEEWLELDDSKQPVFSSLGTVLPVSKTWTSWASWTLAMVVIVWGDPAPGTLFLKS